MKRLVLLLSLLALQPSFAGEPYVVAYYGGSADAQPNLAILREAYRRIGIEVSFRPLPLNREILEVEQGQADADASRSGAALAQHPTLLRIPVPWITSHVHVFTAGPPVTAKSWEDLHPFRICVINGDRMIEQHLQGFDTQTAPDPQAMIHMLRAGRCQVAVKEVNLWAHIDPAEKAHFSSTPFFDLPLYHAVGPRHADLVPKLTQVFTQMRDEGQFALSDH